MVFLNSMIKEMEEYVVFHIKKKIELRVHFASKISSVVLGFVTYLYITSLMNN